MKNILYNIRMNLLQCFLPPCAFFLPNHQQQCQLKQAEPVAGELPLFPPGAENQEDGCSRSSPLRSKSLDPQHAEDALDEQYPLNVPSLRASSVEERPGEDSADPDWDEEVEDRKGDDDPEYDPESKQKASRPLK